MARFNSGCPGLSPPWQAAAQACIDAARARPTAAEALPAGALAPLVTRDSVWSASSYDLHRGLDVIAAHDDASANLLDQWFGPQTR